MNTYRLQATYRKGDVVKTLNFWGKGQQEAEGRMLDWESKNPGWVRIALDRHPL